MADSQKEKGQPAGPRAPSLEPVTSLLSPGSSFGAGSLPVFPKWQGAHGAPSAFPRCLTGMSILKVEEFGEGVSFSKCILQTCCLLGFYSLFSSALLEFALHSESSRSSRSGEGAVRSPELLPGPSTPGRRAPEEPTWKTVTLNC